MLDLFGQPLASKPRPPRRQPAPSAVAPVAPPAEPVAIRRPTGKIRAYWDLHDFYPAEGKLTHFNAGVGFDLKTRKKYPFAGSFGYILLVNDETGEVLVHLPKPRIPAVGRDDEFFIVPFSDLLPTECVPDFDEATFRSQRPRLNCPFAVSWNVTRL